MAATEDRVCVAKAGGTRCTRPIAVRERGLCSAHYKRYQRTGKVGTEPIGPWRPLPVERLRGKPRMGLCRISGCGLPILYPRYGLCRPHYERYRVQRRVQGRSPDLKPIRPREEIKAAKRRKKKEKVA